MIPRQLDSAQMPATGKIRYLEGWEDSIIASRDQWGSETDNMWGLWGDCLVEETFLTDSTVSNINNNVFLTA
jgi:hypothetical protein